MIAVTITTALAVIGCATIAFQARALDHKDEEIAELNDTISDLDDAITELEKENDEVEQRNAVQELVITTLRDRNAILRDTLEAVPSPVATVLDVVSRVGHKLGGFL